MEFVEYFALLKEVPPARVPQAVAAAVERVDLGARAKARLRTLSGGMLRRVGIAQAIVNDPDLLLLDEPTAGLDPEQRVVFRALLRDLGQAATVVVSTHLVEDVGAACSEVALMDAGHIVFRGTPAELTARGEGHAWATPRWSAATAPSCRPLATFPAMAGWRHDRHRPCGRHRRPGAGPLAGSPPASCGWRSGTAPSSGPSRCWPSCSSMTRSGRPPATPRLWTVRASVVLDKFWPVCVPFAAGFCAWAGSREGRRDVGDLLGSTARPAWTRQLCSLAGTLAWVLAAFLAGVAALYVHIARRRPGAARRSGRPWRASPR